MKLYSRNSARRSLLDTVGFRGLSQVSTVVAYAVLVRSMSEDEFGILNLLYAIIPIVNTVGSLGLDHVLRRFQPEYLRAGHNGVAIWLLHSVQRLRFFSNLLLVAVAMVIWQWVAPLFHLAGHRVDFAIFSVLLVLHFQLYLLQFSSASHMLHRYSVGSAAVLALMKLVTYGLLALNGVLTLRNAIYADLLSYIAATGFIWLAHHRAAVHGHRSVPLERGPERTRLRKYAIFTHWNDATSVLQYPDTDRLFIAARMTPAAVGAYSFYTKLTEMMTSLVPLRLFDNVVQPMFFGVPRDEAHYKIPRYFTFLINISLMYQLPMIAFTAVYHQDLVQVIFGGKFIEYSFLLPIVVFFSTTDNVLSIPIHLVAQYREKAEIILKSQLVGIYQIAAMLTLLPLFGLLGAALASGSFHLLRNLFVWWKVRGDAVWTNWRSVLLSAALVWGTAIALCIGLRWALPLPPLVEMATGGIILGLAALVYVRTGAIGDDDRLVLSGVMHGPERRVLRLIGLLRDEGEAHA